MRVPRIADIDALPIVGPAAASLFAVLGITDDDLPHIVPDLPDLATEQGRESWMRTHFPSLAQKLAALKEGAA